MSLHKAIAVSLLLHAAFFAAAMIRIVYFPVIQAARGFAVEFMNSGSQGQTTPGGQQGPGTHSNPGGGIKRGANTGTVSDLLNSITYPPLAEQMELEGTVTVETVVGKDGQTLSARVIKSSGHEILDRAAAEGIMHWIFTDVAGGVKTNIRVKFKLK